MRPSFLTRLGPALTWLRESNIQCAEGPDAGGVYAWIDERTGEPAFLYSEITGYFITLCTHLARHDPHGDWLDRARAAGQWVVDRALHPSGAVLSRKYADPAVAQADPWSFERGWVAFFDSAMVGFGLMQLYRVTGDKRWFDAALAIGNFLLDHFDLAGTGLRAAAYDLHSRSLVPPGPRWSQHFGPFELKGAMFLVELGEASADARFDTAVDAMLGASLDAQRPEGRFPTDPSGATTHLHPNAYTIEGLLFLAIRRSRLDLVARAWRAIDWTFSTCLSEAWMQQWSQVEADRIAGMRADALAQALRAYAIARAIDPAPRFAWEGRVVSLFSMLDSFALPSCGTAYGMDEAGEKGTHANAWVHCFRVEAELFRELGSAAWDQQLQKFILT